jgi:NAD(P)-dependent dehydrogenase (short-subunit alcohol dehydrogenase family)
MGTAEVTSRVVVVTGANRGLGREAAHQFASHGDTVVLTARDLAKAQRAADDEHSHGHTVDARQLDVTDTASVERLAADLADRYGRVDVLVNNAAILYDTWQSVASADLDVVREAVETNLLGAWRLAIALLPLVRASEHGRIVNVSSESGSLRSMGGDAPAYRVSKTSLNALTRMLAADLAADGIVVNAICPGWTATDMGEWGGRPVADGAAGILWAANLPDTGPTGGFFRDGQPLAW